MKKATETPHPGSSDTGVTGVTENGHQDAAVRTSASRPRARSTDTDLHSPMVLRIAEIVQIYGQTHSAKETVGKILGVLGEDGIGTPTPRTAAGPWIAVTERMPEAGVLVLVWCSRGYGLSRIGADSPSFWATVTHWSELRPPTGGRR